MHNDKPMGYRMCALDASMICHPAGFTLDAPRVVFLCKRTNVAFLRATTAQGFLVQ